MLRIGVCDSIIGQWHAGFTQSELQKVGASSEVVVFKNEIEEALLRGEIDLAVHSMNSLPTVQPEGLVITAVSRREDPSDLLLVRREAVDEDGILKLKPGASVGFSSGIQKAQMPDFRPDVFMKNFSRQEVPYPKECLCMDRGSVFDFLEKLRSGELDSAILPAAELLWMNVELADFQAIKLNPREFVPSPAQGVVAWQTNRDDLETRQILKIVHHPETSALTNVERKVLQLLGGIPLPLGVFCERDGTGFFHVFAACQIGGEFRRVQISQSTNFGLAERVLAGLKNE